MSNLSTGVKIFLSPADNSKNERVCKDAENRDGRNRFGFLRFFIFKIFINPYENEEFSVIICYV